MTFSKEQVEGMRTLSHRMREACEPGGWVAADSVTEWAAEVDLLLTYLEAATRAPVNSESVR